MAIKSSKDKRTEIGSTTTFSGSDIEVFAYRDNENRSPARFFSVDNQIKETQQEINSLEKQKLETERRAFSSQAPPNVDGAVLSEFGNSSFNRGNSSSDTNGRFQNEQDLIGTSRAQAERARLQSLNREIGRKQATLGDLTKKKADEQSSTFTNLGTIHTVSYSSFREKFAVRSLGKVQAKGYTRGPRTISGSMVFNVIQEHELLSFLTSSDENERMSHPRAVMLDQIKPFNLLLLFTNEFGSYSALHLFNVDIASEGQVMSIDEVITMNTMNFYATDMIPMTALGTMFNSTTDMLNETIRRTKEQFQDSSDAAYKSQARIDTKIRNPFTEDKKEFRQMLSESRGLF